MQFDRTASKRSRRGLLPVDQSFVSEGEGAPLEDHATNKMFKNSKSSPLPGKASQFKRRAIDIPDTAVAAIGQAQLEENR